MHFLCRSLLNCVNSIPQMNNSVCEHKTLVNAPIAKEDEGKLPHIFQYCSSMTALSVYLVVRIGNRH
jgi:hypothetical protein